MPLPAGFELTEATGSTLDSSELRTEFWFCECANPASAIINFWWRSSARTPRQKRKRRCCPWLGRNDETGELLVEGVGAMELTPTESGGLRRIDVREAGAMRGRSRGFLLQAAFRYNRRPGRHAQAATEWRQFPDSQVLSAVCRTRHDSRPW